MKKRTIVIGDIHGGLLALQQLLARIDLRATDTLIFLGDYVDGWPDVAALIDALIALEKTHHCIFLRGNHDAWCEEWLRTGKATDVWLFNSGNTTVASYKGVDADVRKTHLGFFERLRNYYILESEQLFLHAGFSSMHGPAGEHYESNFYWDRTLWETALATEKNLPETSPRYPCRLRHFREIFIGHTPTLRYGSEVPMQACNVWNVDTGAGFQGRLSALDMETKAVWQSDPVFMLYPNHSGRSR